MKHEGSAGMVSSAASVGVELSPDRAATLARYEDLLRERGADLGLVAEGDLPRLRDRHVLDSLRAAPLVPRRARRLCDLGSGAGLPGVVLAIALPSVAVVLSEVRRGRVGFLELVVDELRLSNVEVVPGRIEDLRGIFDVCTARAFAPPLEAWRVAERLLSPGGRLLYWAGRRFDPSGIPARIELSSSPALARSGPVVIMTRQ